MPTDAALSPDQIKAAVAKLLEQTDPVSDRHRGAIVAYANGDKVEVALGTRIAGGWQIDLIGSHEWTGGRNEIGVMNRITW